MPKLISTNPAKGYEEIGSVNITTNEEIIEIVAKANTAKKTWKETPLDIRIGYFDLE